MRRTLSILTLAALPALGVSQVYAQQAGDPGISDAAAQQISEIIAFKQGLTPEQAKMDSSLIFSVLNARGQVNASVAATTANPVAQDSLGNVIVDIYGTVTPALLADIAAAFGVVLDIAPRFGIVHAALPLGSIETVAANSDVKNIQLAAQGRTNAGPLTSQGYISHGANQVVNSLGYNGSGVLVGVLSDSASPARVAALIASGDLPAGTQVIVGQQGTGADEGAAMMEIVHDVAPGANLIFATAKNGVASFANNILALQAFGARVIVDDFTYFNEGAFQDGPIAQAVNQVTASGAIYLSSAANSGNLTFSTSGTWEGDFRPNGSVGAPITEPGILHNFGTAGSPQNFDLLIAPTNFISLKWSDPLGASTNDYDLFILNSTGTTVKGFSVGLQNGTQDPFEFVQQGTGCGTPTPVGYCPAPNDRIVVVLFAGATRALHVDTNQGRLSIATTGSTFGHNAGLNTVSTAATYWNSAKIGTKPFTGAANPIETFSSDGPRKIFFNPDGTPITPGNFLFGTNGGTTLAKPDITAADGVSTKTPGFLPFFGTSAAAPHAAGIAALIFSAKPSLTPAQVLDVMKSTALDNMAPGVDRDSGAGIVMAPASVQKALTLP